MSVDKLEVETLVSCLRELMTNCEPFIHQARSVDQAEEMMGRLEENDENFHKHEFVKTLRGCLDNDLGPLIDAEIEKQALGRHDGGGSEDLVERITDKVINSREYLHLSKSLKTNVGQALDHILTNYTEELGSRRSIERATGAKGESDSDNIQRSFSISDVDSFSSSFKGGSLFVTQDQLIILTESLDKKRGPEARKQALCSLIHMHAIDVQSGEYWAGLRRGLLEALADPDETLASLALRFVAKGFSSSSPNTREMYSTLVDYLENQFSDKRTGIPKIRSGLDLKKPEFGRIIRGFRLINEFQLQIPQYWVRYSEKFLEDILHRTLSLLSVHYKLPAEDARLTPVHFIAILDPRAGWFTKWMHGNYSRTPMVRLLGKYRPLLIEAVKSCVRFLEPANLSRSPRRQTSSGDSSDLDREGQKMNFSPSHLDYLHFVHSLSMLARLICCSNGRNLFPVVLREKEAPITVEKLIDLFISFLANKTRRKPTRKSYLEPSTLITEALKKMATLNRVCAACLCTPEVIHSLMAPFSTLVKERSIPPNQEFIFLQLSEILMNIAANKEGRLALLRPGKNKRSSADVLAELIQRAIIDRLELPTSVMVALTYICRQNYSTAEGLESLRPFMLHQVLAKAWKEALENSERTATPTEERSIVAKDSNTNPLFWEETLRDNLLNFANTPRGLLLLQQTGAINDCASYMFTRYIKKLQVSKCEKFGYGFMLTQMAATAPGISALLNTGFVTTLVHDVWASIEGPVGEDWPVHSPKHWPVDPIDKLAHKPLTKMLNILSAFAAVYEVIAHTELPNKLEYSFREAPDTITGLIDRIIMVDSDAKILSLFNYEQSHIFGLRVLSVMISCLDTFLLLQTQYKFQEMLIKNQQGNITDENSAQVIIDSLSIERSYILVKSFIIGGPSERILPPRTLQDDHPELYPYPLVAEYPLPSAFLPLIPSLVGTTSSASNPIGQFLRESRDAELGHDLLEACRRAFHLEIRKTPTEKIKQCDLVELMERAIIIIASVKDRTTFPEVKATVTESTLNAVQLREFDQLGVEMALRYGERLHLVKVDEKTRSDFIKLLKSVRVLTSLQTKPSKSDLKFLNGCFKGFDWFVSTVFLFFKGDFARSWTFLQKLFPLPESAYLWPQRIHQSAVLSSDLRSSGVSVLFFKTCHYVELILSKELPQVHSAFRMSGYPAAQLVQDWLGQCFWTRLDWATIVQTVCLTLVLSPDYQVYLCVALLKHLASDILQQLQKQNLVIFLKEEPITNFLLCDHLPYMQTLEERYRDKILPDLLDINRL